MRVRKLHYSNTNTYLIESDRGKLLFDTGWAGTFPAFCHALGQIGVSLQDIDFILISHFHPDHMGIAQQIADQGPVLLVADVQKEFVHTADSIFAKEKTEFRAIDEEKARIFALADSRELLKEIGIEGQILHTPGHSDDSISLMLDDGNLFVGDLNPLYELELHKGTQIGDSWDKLLILEPKVVYYGHAKKAVLTKVQEPEGKVSETQLSVDDRYALVSAIIRLIDKGADVKKIQKKTGADSVFIQDVMRMYLTHQNVGVQGILDRIEIKNR